jgi:hypothetical protein
MGSPRTHRPPMTQAPNSLRDRVLAATARAPSPTRRQGRTAAGVLVAASIAVAVTVFEGAGGIGHGASRPLGLTVALAGGWTFVSAVLTWLVVGRKGSTMARRPLVVLGAALATPLFLFLWMHAFNGAYAEPFDRTGYRCLAYTLVMSALPLASFLALKRAIEPRYPSTSSSATWLRSLQRWWSEPFADTSPWACVRSKEPVRRQPKKKDVVGRNRSSRTPCYWWKGRGKPRGRQRWGGAT